MKIANQAEMLRNADAVVAARKPVGVKKVEKGHGRIETRLTRVYRLDDPAQLGLFGSQTLVLTCRLFEYVAGAMLLARSALFVYFARSGMTNCQAFKEEMQLSPGKPLRLVTRGG